MIRIGEGRTRLTVDHNKEYLTFLHPAYGPDTYANVGKQIEKDQLLKPTMAETVSLVHAAFDSYGRYSDEIKKIMESRWIWAFTGILYVPKKGAYIQDNPKIRKGLPYMNKKNLEGKLKKGDKTVRFVPFGYKVGKMSALELAKNDFIKALAGEEGAEKLAEIARKYKVRPCLWGYGRVDKLTTRVSSVDSNWGLEDRRLYVCGGSRGYCRAGCSFGVQKNTKKEK